MLSVLFQLGIGLTLVALILTKSKPKVSPLRVFVASFGMGVVCLVLMMVMVLIQSLLSFFIVGLLAACGARRSVIVAATYLCLIAGLGFLIHMQWSEVQRLVALRDEFPMTSLAPRLAYEEQDARQHETPAVALSQEATQRLSRLEEVQYRGIRRNLLEKLHDDQYLAFATAQGFGMVRMIRPNRTWLIIREPEPDKLPERPQQIDPPTAIQAPILAATENRNALPDLTNLHDLGLKSFLDSERFGFVKTRQVAAGFEPHAMTGNSAFDLRRQLVDWQISRLDLVSLLKFPEPRVYLSEQLPRMDELRNAETRPADEFELHALAQLRDGEDNVIDQQLNTIRMVGAVRAANQCLDCHSVRRGELLGAFSYLLDRKQPIRPPKIEGEPVSMTRRRSNES